MDYTDQIEPFVGPTQAPPADPPAASPYGERYDKLVKFLEGVDVKPSFVPDAKTFMDAPLKAKIGTLLSAGMMMVPAGRMGSTPRAAPRAPAPELHELLGENSPRPAASGGEPPPAAADNVVPLRPQLEPTAETANANARVAGEPTSDPGTYTPYEIPKAERGYPDTANSNKPGGRFTWDVHGGTAREPDFWYIKSGDNQSLANVSKIRQEGEPVRYVARAFIEGEYPDGQRWERSPYFKTSDVAKRWAEAHVKGEPATAEALEARENFTAIEGGAREASRFEQPSAESMTGEAGAPNAALHEVLGDQPLSRQGLAKSDAPLEARTSALVEGIDKAIDHGQKLRASINSYVGSAYKTLNAIHRRGTPDQLDKVGFSKKSIGGQENDVKYREISDHLDQAISKTRLADDATLYRGVGQTLAGELAALKPGQTITDKAFMSTSKREEVANGFASGSGIMRTIIEIKAPKGMPALDIGLLSKRNVEQEVVLPRNTELRYIGRTSRFNRNLTPVYQFEVVPSWESESQPTIGSSTRTARGSSSNTPTGDNPTSSVRRPRPSYRQSPTSESSARSKQGDAKDVSMFEPPTRAPRPFEADYPNGAPHEGTGIITRDIEGRPLTAPFVAGRNTVGGADRPISPAHYDAITKGLLGEAAQEIPQGSRPGNVGNTLFDTQSRLPFRVELVKGINKTQRPRVYGHEVGHVLDQFAMEIPTAGIERELYKLYNSLNNPIRTKGGNDAHPWSRRMTPQRMGYEEDARPRELIAEAMRAYMANPNYIKAEAPNVAKRLRSYVNAHPWIKKTIQLNSLGALGIIATEHDEL